MMPRHPLGSILFVVALAQTGSAVQGADTGFLDRAVAVKGVTYRYQVYLPQDYDPSGRYPVILFLHGAGERGDDGLLQTQVGLGAAVRLDRRRFPFIVVFPQARRETLWTGDMSAQALASLDKTIKEFRGDPQRVYLIGLSMGGYGTWSIAAQTPGTFAAVVPVCGWVTQPSIALPDDRVKRLREGNPFIQSANPYAAAAARIGKTPTWIFHGAADPVVAAEESRKMFAALKESGGDVKYTEYDGVGHNSWDRAFAEPELVPWLLSHRLPARPAIDNRRPADYPAPVQGDFVVKNFRFASGEVLPELRLHYRTVGTPARDAQGVVRNAVLVMHGTGGSGNQFIRPDFAGELFGAGALLDATRYFIVLPDGIGHGRSSKPSDGLRARFPRYGYLDMVEAQYRLLTEGLGVNHLRLVMGTSMGGMHTWLWGQRYPDFMDALMPLASLPTQISGRNRVWRRVAIDAIRNDPEWRRGEYTAQPQGLRTAQGLLYLMSSNPVLRQQQAPTLEAADAALDASLAASMKTADANDLLYQLEASRDYDPGPGLERIRAPLIAVNSADDLINPLELGVLEREIKRVPKGRAIVLPFGPETRGHGSHTVAALWSEYLAELLKEEP